MEWKSKGVEEKPYKARLINHEAKTSLDYGEKTWTTAQTVRDLMQNHLDAETERYYGNISSMIFDDDKFLKLVADEKGSEHLKKEIDNFLYSAYMFVNHVGDMTPEVRAVSEEHLQKLTNNLPIKDSFLVDGIFQTSKLLEQARQIPERLPLISYEITDQQTNQPVGFLAYETLRDEKLYQQKADGKFRYQIDGLKIADHGAGYDSQLSSLYISSKTGKKHVRGKFGEGAKMSELHLLRNRAKIKMRSQYIFKNRQGGDVNRLWQTKSKIKGGRLVSEGVEIENYENENTGSMVYVSFKDSKETFKDDLVKNIDPRVNGLTSNVAEFGSQNFIYPMPITEKCLVGINISGKGDEQYVQGLRVELAADAFGYSEPWFSYDILDSSVIAGRDRNEIKGEIVDKIKNFWKHNDNPGLLKKLVQTAVHDETRSKFSSMELGSLNEILMESIKGNGKKEEPKKVQATIDQELINELSLEKGVPTLVLSQREYRECSDKEYRKSISYAHDQNYRIITTASHLYSSSIEAFAKRISQDYKIFSLGDIIGKIRENDNFKRPEFVEGERERKIQEVFALAADSVNSFSQAAGLPTQKFSMGFDLSANNHNRNSDYENDYESDYLGGDNDFQDNFSYYDESESYGPIWMGSDKLMINPNKISDPRHGNPHELQRQLELYLLSGYRGYNFYNNSENDDYSEDQMEETEDGKEMMKQAQHFLDSVITKLIPNNSPLLEAIPNSFNYEKNKDFIARLCKEVFEGDEAKRTKNRESYVMFRRALSAQLNINEAKQLFADSLDNDYYEAKNIVENRVFNDNNSLSYYNKSRERWDKINLKSDKPISEWNELPVYELGNGRLFISAPMNPGAVVAKGEGKEREYIINEGENFLEIGRFGVGFYEYGMRSNSVSVQPAGFVLDKQNSKGKDILTVAEYVKKQLQEYSYYPTGNKENTNNKIVEGISTTAIPIEYGKDEWDNPIRVFQDIVQNHIDASLGAGGVKLIYEVIREGKRLWIEKNDVQSGDKISGLQISDNGGGYSPSEIATMGASSKKSPLFAGKYGEGQKMVAAAALRGGLDLEYQSFIKNDQEVLNWNAQAVIEDRRVVLDGEEAEKKLVAFNVGVSKDQSKVGSRTIFKLSKNANSNEEKQWAQWASIIDPRQKDERGNTGLSRYIRQIRKSNSDREYRLGSVTMLLDEPGAVYENGLRINPGAEKGRTLAFGYDVPEVVTTRERNSYNPDRLKYYARHIFSHLTDPLIIGEILKKIVDDHERSSDLSIISSYKTAQPIWAEVAQKLWPDYLVHSHDAFRKPQDDSGDAYFFETKAEYQKRIENEKLARKIDANMVHFDRKKILFLSKNNYEGFSRMLPTLESAIGKLETEKLPISPELKKILSTIVAQSANIYKDVYQKAKESLTDEQVYNHPLLNAYQSKEKVNEWSDVDKIIKNPNGVGVAPITSGFHGRADQGVVFNEVLLVENDKRKLAEVSLHEMAHIVSGRGDYEEEFVDLLYELAKHFIKEKL